MTNDYKKNSFIIVSNWFLFYFVFGYLLSVFRKRSYHNEHREKTQRSTKNICHRFTDFGIGGLGFGDLGLGVWDLGEAIDRKNLVNINLFS